MQEHGINWWRTPPESITDPFNIMAASWSNRACTMTVFKLLIKFILCSKLTCVSLFVHRTKTSLRLILQGLVYDYEYQVWFNQALLIAVIIIWPISSEFGWRRCNFETSGKFWLQLASQYFSKFWLLMKISRTRLHPGGGGGGSLSL